MVVLAWLIERLVLRPLVNQDGDHAAHGDARPRLLPRRLRPDDLCGSDIYKIDLGMPNEPMLLPRVRVPGRHPDQQGRPVAAAIAAALVAAAGAVLPEDRAPAARCARWPTTTRRRSRSASRCKRIWVIVWSVAGVVALVAGMIWGSKLGVQFSLTLVALQGAAGGDPRRLHVGAGRDRRRADHRRGREAVRGLPRPAASAAASRTGSPTCWRCCSCWCGPRACSARRSSIGSETCSTAKTASSRPATARTSRSSRSCRTASSSALLLAFAFVVVPLHGERLPVPRHPDPVPDPVAGRASALNILVGYCGQISLGTAAFMAVGAYARLQLHRAHAGHAADSRADPGRPVRDGLSASLFGLPSLRIKACTWRWRRWRRSSSPTGCSCASSGSPTTRPRARSRRRTWRSSAWRIDTPVEQVPVLPGRAGGVFALAGQEPGARRTSAAHGWRCATWTWPPR